MSSHQHSRSYHEHHSLGALPRSSFRPHSRTHLHSQSSNSPWRRDDSNSSNRSPLSLPPNASPVAAPYIPIPDRGHGHTTHMRMDPFEVRIRFTGLLQHLNASLTSANKAAQYALKYRDMDEDLHSCILEQLERNTMNIRANIMYFLEYLCDMAARENHWDYVRMIQRDILRIVDAVAPEDGSGAANVKVVRKVLKALETKTFLLAQTVGEIEECLKERDIAPDAVGMSSPLGPQEGRNGEGKEADTPTGKAKGNPFGKLDRKQAEQRIEEDRERHKRQRETAWAVSRDESEFERVWNETGELGEDDFEMWREEAEERLRAGREWKEEYLNRVGGGGAE